MSVVNPLTTLIAGLDPEKRAVLAQLLRPAPEPIAVVGMGCRFPGGVTSPDTFWELLKDGRDGIGDVPADRWDMDAFYDPIPDAPGKSYARQAGFVGDVASFDAEFFGISPREALRMDPQQRLLLEVAWEALEHAGLAADRLAGSATGVFMGITENYYTARQLQVDLNAADDPYFGLGGSLSSAVGRLAYQLDFRGPTLALDTACSSSLVALSLACQSLRNQDCDMAIAGGVHVLTMPIMMIVGAKTRMLAPDGRCKTFDARANGYGFAEGCGMVVVKRLKDARAAGDRVLAIIRGIAVNEDGRSNGLTAPNGLAQQAVIRQALVNAGIEPGLVSYVEAHGSGTPLGDPIEVEALQAVFCAGRTAAEPLTIATVKTNIGHAVCAAGMAGLIKTILALQHRQIPPHLHLQERNPAIPWDDRYLRVPDALIPWSAIDGRRIAGVSSFGWSGTNAHVIVEEPEPEEASDPIRAWHLLVLSARSRASLDQTTQRLAHHLREGDGQYLADIAYTLQVGRTAFAERRVLVCRDREDAAGVLETLDPQRVLTGTAAPAPRPITFMFPGLGDHYAHLGQELYRTEPTFRAHVDRCCELLLPELGFDLRTVLFPAGERLAASGNRLSLDLPAGPARDTAPLERTAIAQPALFVIEYALAQLWISWEVKPQALIGYSLGEYVAACLAGVLSLEDALRLVARRAQLIDALPAGAMLAIALPEERTRAMLNGALSLAAINGPLMSVVAGTPEAVDHLQQQLSLDGIACRRLKTTHAFHSSLMEPIVADLRRLLGEITLHAPRIPYVSNVSGTWIRAEQAQDPEYWIAHLRRPVCFAEGIQTLWQKPGNILLEVGAAQTLGSLAMQHPARSAVADPLVLASLPAAHDPQPEAAMLLRSLGRLWLAGARIGWAGIWAHEKRRRVTLPTYSFERQRYWPELSPTAALWPVAEARVAAAPPPTLQPEGQRETSAGWFQVPSWRTRPLLPATAATSGGHWLLFLDEQGVGAALADGLRRRGQEVIAITAGTSFTRIDESTYTINERAPEDYSALIKHLRLVGWSPNTIVHLWSLASPASRGTTIDEAAVERTQQRGFYSVLFLTQALGQQRDTGPAQLWLISNNAQAVLGDDILCPDQATMLGILEVLPKENPTLGCASIDLDLRSTDPQRLAGHVLGEMLGGEHTGMVAYRGRSRWVRAFEPVRLDQDADRAGATRMRTRGVYLITGGFGGLGYALAQELAHTYQARLVLLGRTPLPPREAWPDATGDDAVRRRIEQVLALEALGAEVLALDADVSRRAELQRAIDAARARFGQINGVFHTAGVPGQGLIQFKQEQAAAQVLAPKVQGTLALTALLAGEPLDFMVLYSSINAIIGGLGEADYCAANAFMDAFAHYQHRQGATQVTALNWGLWQWDAWQSSLLVSLPEIYGPIQELRRTHGITFEEGTQALRRALGALLPQVVISPIPLETVLQQARALPSLADVALARLAPDRPVYPRPSLRTPYVPPRTGVEEKIAAIWADALAIEQVGIDDHFLELGGNSLLSTVITLKLEREFGITLSPAVLYEGPTVSALSDLLFPAAVAPAPLVEYRERGQLRKELRDQRRRARA